jgi:autotransporter-associated beta strand protein
VFSSASVLDIQSGKVYLRRQTNTGMTMAGLTGAAGTVLTTDGTFGGVQKITINATSGNYTYAGIIGKDPGYAGSIDSMTLTKSGAGTQILTGANTYTGSTTISGGTLKLDRTGGPALVSTASVTVAGTGVLLISQSNQVNDSATITLSGGTITRGGGVNEAFASLNLTTGSFLDFGTGATGSMTFGTYEENTTPSALLTINNFLPGNSFTFSNAQFAASGSNIGSYFTFGTGFQGRQITDLGSGTFTITAIPEPSTVVAALGLAGLMLWPAGRRYFGRRAKA